MRRHNGLYTWFDHPLIRHKVGLLREHDISTSHFRTLANEIARLLTYEATKDFETERVTIQGWAGEVEVERIKGKKVTVVPILRAGLGMMDGVYDMIPGAKASCGRFLPQRGDPQAGPVLRQARQQDRRTRGAHPRSHAGNRWHPGSNHTASQGRGLQVHPGVCSCAPPPKASNAFWTPIPTWTSTLRRLTKDSTTLAISSRVSETREIKYSAPSR